ncbi:hypothetical protein SO802_013430 [Lithocarpus litseifolius]|uniref:Uncharacterized protein n=1 Tax=Lithocarpus litseifolius TaxID=425828 RepID=A0AAW2D723_9ROSI
MSKFLFHILDGLPVNVLVCRSVCPKNIVLAALEELPHPDLLLKILNEDEDSLKEPIHKYINAAKVVLQYIDSVFQSTETGAEMLRTI